VTVPCQECGVELAGDSPELRLELTRDDEPDRVLRRALGASGSSSMAKRAASDVVRSAGLASNAGLRD
jgi:hypothetical protein